MMKIWEFIYDGKTKRRPQINIFDNTYDLEHLPERVTLRTINNGIMRKYYQSQQTTNELKRKDIKKNRWIAGLMLLLIIVGVLAIVL
ncbi:MAG: hypothetical protein LBS52_07560 [Dysgonamonadaceae bacterium]|jgi:hypothetical protein|nr:hypothetical protein [Dysgonamonadaceae bacterium]